MGVLWPQGGLAESSVGQWLPHRLQDKEKHAHILHAYGASFFFFFFSLVLFTGSLMKRLYSLLSQVSQAVWTCLAELLCCSSALESGIGDALGGSFV